MKFRNETAEKLMCHYDMPNGFRETIWVKPGQVVDFPLRPEIGEVQGLTCVPDEPEPVTAKVGEAKVETKVSKRSRRKK